MSFAQKNDMLNGVSERVVEKFIDVPNRSRERMRTSIIEQIFSIDHDDVRETER